MPSKRAIIRRSTTLAIAAAMIGALLAIPITAADASVTGTLSTQEPVELTPTAVAIVTIIDQTAAPEAGAIVGQQRIDAPTQVPIDFAVVVDLATIDPTHAYALFATITDGPSTWQNPVGQPVITGGPSKGVELTLPATPASTPASITGTIAVPAATVLSPAAVSIAALIKVDTGTLVSRQVQSIADPAAVAFTVGFDPSLTDPAATYVIKAAIVDGGAVWQNREGVAAIQGGVPASAIEVPVTLVGTSLPGFSPAPSGSPAGSTAPSAPPSGAATAEPTETAEPSEGPSATPTATPAPTATPTPTPAPTATPTPTPTPSPKPTPSPTAIPTTSPTAAPSNAPTPSPITGPLKGTLTYKESYQLTPEAFAIVALVRGSARAEEDTIVASEIDRNVSAKPIAFELDFDASDIDPTVTYTVQAILVDGENAWVTGKGVPVLTKGNPSTVAITLNYRPDLVKGTVSGQISAIGLQPTANAYAVAVLIDPATGATLGIDAKSAPAGLPAEFAIPYAITDIVPANDYVVAAEVIDDNVTWRSPAGVPVITNGNPKNGVQVVITEVAVTSPPPSTPTPVPSAAPQPPVDETGSGGLIGIIILIAIVGGVVAFLIARGRGQPDAVTSPTDPSAAPAAGEPGAPTEPPPATPPDGEGPAA